MAKQVFPRNEVAHLWVHRAQDSARVAGGNFYFTGATLYSYGSHFVCGHLMPEAYNVESAPLVLVNADNYSNTTARHMHAMYHALPGYYKKFSVSGLNDGMVRNIGRDGAWAVIAAIMATMRDRLADAATTKHVRHTTRAASLAIASHHADMVRHLATVDAGRKDLSKELRATARAILRALPAADDFKIDGADRDAIMALVKRVNREKARSDYAEKIERFRHKAKRVSEYVERDTLEYAAHWHREARDAINLFDHYVKRDADIGSIRISNEDKLLRGAMGAALPILEQREAKADREEQVSDWNNRVTAMAGINHTNFLAAESYLSGMRTLAEQLAVLDTDDEKAERAATLARLDGELKTRKAETAPERCAHSLEVAETFINAGHYLDGKTYVREARRIAERDASESDRAGLLDRCDAIASRIDDATRERRESDIAAWRDGSSNHLRREWCEDGALLRVRGDVIETSWGATVPLDVAPLVWRLVSNAKRNGATQAWAHGEGPRLGVFRLNSVSAYGDIIAGCHRINYDELARMAAALGYANGDNVKDVA
jgi:hypothetical protein